LCALVDPAGTGAVDGQVAGEVGALGREYVARRKRLFHGNAWGRYLCKYDDELQLVEGKRERDAGGNCSALRCRWCRAWIHDLAEACPICATKVGLVKWWFGIWMW
jgi:hypothetical protein